MSILAKVAEMTGTAEADWQFIDGPESGCGVDYWCYNKVTGQEVYANDDQGHITMEVMED